MRPTRGASNNICRFPTALLYSTGTYREMPAGMLRFYEHVALSVIVAGRANCGCLSRIGHNLELY